MWYIKQCFVPFRLLIHMNTIPTITTTSMTASTAVTAMNQVSWCSGCGGGITPKPATKQTY